MCNSQHTCRYGILFCVHIHTFSTHAQHTYRYTNVQFTTGQPAFMPHILLHIVQQVECIHALHESAHFTTCHVTFTCHTFLPRYRSGLTHTHTHSAKTVHVGLPTRQSWRENMRENSQRHSRALTSRHAVVGAPRASHDAGRGDIAHRLHGVGCSCGFLCLEERSDVEHQPGACCIWHGQYRRRFLPMLHGEALQYQYLSSWVCRGAG
jgi:hypothetical protein